ncbi:hypothetical protein DEU56DRAFT_747776, partial [Suillus clintonianus]|uniref:uncharacterized protein n=1 Tax=Suillus clintonianus TaxID=1904413 RepID=UPI001B88409F
SGYPSSGKLIRAAQIHDFFSSPSPSSASSPQIKVEAISDDDLAVDRAKYSPRNSLHLYHKIHRQKYDSQFLIVDEINYIKGFRCQLYCKSREAGVRVSTMGNRLRCCRSHN